MLKTSKFQYFNFPFEHFNPIQETAYPFFTIDCNLVISTSMSSGKTAIAEGIMAYELSKKDAMVCYVSPLKALTKEKYDDWKNRNEFKDLNVVVLSSDNYLDDSKIADSQIMLATIEALDVKVRKRCDWIKKLKCFVFDEAHLLGHNKRGSDAEALIMSLTERNKDCRIIFLSGTLKNAKEIAQWLKSLNGKVTKLVKSNWQPMKIDKEVVYFESYDEMYNKVLEQSYEVMDKMLVFVHSKKIGEKLVRFLLDNSVKVAFYHSDLDRKRRAAIARRFSDEVNDLDVLVATSALGMGINL